MVGVHFRLSRAIPLCASAEIVLLREAECSPLHAMSSLRVRCGRFPFLFEQALDADCQQHLRSRVANCLGATSSRFSERAAKRGLRKRVECGHAEVVDNAAALWDKAATLRLLRRGGR